VCDSVTPPCEPLPLALFILSRLVFSNGGNDLSKGFGLADNYRFPRVFLYLG
jgi:hypothetical protein